MVDLRSIDVVDNRRRMERGELYYAFTPDLVADRRRCKAASDRFNAAPGEASRRTMVELWKGIVNDSSPSPPEVPSPEADESLFDDYPWVEGPITKIDYGYNVKLGKGVFVNAGSVWIDTCTIEVGARTLIGPNCSFYSGTHPIDPFVRNGTNGPETGRPVSIGADCWIGGNAMILPGVTIGRGVTVGAGSVVTKDVPDFVVVAGNPARVLRKIDVSQSQDPTAPSSSGVEVLAGENTHTAS